MDGSYLLISNVEAKTKILDLIILFLNIFLMCASSTDTGRKYNSVDLVEQTENSCL